MTPIEERKTKAIRTIEEKMQDLDTGSLRYQALEAAKGFKSSWIQLGRYLYTICQDKAYKEWGYITFEAYCAKEIGIKKQTAVKLLKSYYFLENEEPQALKLEKVDRDTVSKIPSYEAVNLLRLVKASKTKENVDYGALRQDVLEGGRDLRDIKKELRVMSQQEAGDPLKIKEGRRLAAMRRMVSTLKSLKN